MTKFYIGIDIGTTSIKVTVVDKKMNTLDNLQYDYKYHVPKKDFSEVDPDLWIEIVLKGLKVVFHRFSAETIAGIGITGQMHTTVFVDKKKQPVRPAILWNDSRTHVMVPRVKKKLFYSKQSAHIASIVSTGSPLLNLLWVKQEEIKQYNKIDKVLIAKDYVILKLTNVYSTDYCDASTSSFFDLYQEQWSQEVMELFDLSPTLFPKINFSSKIVGRLTKEIQKKLGINSDIPVVAGTGDNVSSALILGSFFNNQPFISLGTSGVIGIPNKRNQLKKVGKNVIAKIQKDDNNVLTQGTVQSGAKANSWWLENILYTKGFSEEQDKIPHSLLGKNKVLFLPHLNGEKTLYSLPKLKGAFVGLDLDTTREAMYLAVLEGVAFGIRTLYEAMKNTEKPKYFSIVGGGAKSKLWVQIFANVLQIPMKKINESQEAVHGAALLAIIGKKEQFNFEHTDYQMVMPQAQLAQSYEEKYQKYLKLTELAINYMKS